MKPDPSFGIITSCCPHDLHMLVANLASIRYFYPEMPVAIIADGGVSLAAVSKRFDIHTILRPGNSPDPRVRKLCSENNRSKLLAVWEGPFERFLYTDSDSIIWGRPLEPVIHSETDFQLLRPSAWKQHSQANLSEFYVNPDLIGRFDPDFEWQRQPYFCSGAFGCRRGLFSIEEWLVCEDWRREEPLLFSWTKDQGIMNYLVLKGMQEGRITGEEIFIQVTTGDRKPEDLEKLYPCRLSQPKLSVDNPAILHFSGKKPLLQHPSHFQTPFLYFRLLGNTSTSQPGSLRRLWAWMIVFRDEVTVFLRRCFQKIRRLLSQS